MNISISSIGCPISRDIWPKVVPVEIIQVEQEKMQSKQPAASVQCIDIYHIHPRNQR